MTAARRAWPRAAVAALTSTLWVLCALPGAARAASEPGTGDITPAERLIFLTDHLHGVAAQTELDYAFVDSAQPSHAADVVKVLVVSPDNAKGDAQVSDHGGNVNLPIGGLQCNPAIIYFLEHDIAEMQGATGGQRRYFQQRLRLALAAGPKIENAPGQFGGKQVNTRRIVVQPYLHDPNAARFEQLTGKRYTFVLADDVPGQIVQIRTDVPGPNNDFAHPAHSETLSFQSALRKLPSDRMPAKPAANAPRASR
ncbi:hypothetical protein LJ656_26340 [Paraburkholderia sp. MMS20-SJTR3]|uniref:Uncharacterized protein n=1 Tax=Paraburkholderia sejongensis TaxID=2886946 RepID=A0ABS8K1S3_9BURK|nr:hypothetical protein [Paraburkholderia sp. MMS20-SJTR3]MCC8396113.1 hypothetical protein [Paraburkholderia sp. MMS20-SJTR3]